MSWLRRAWAEVVWSFVVVRRWAGPAVVVLIFILTFLAALAIATGAHAAAS